MKQNENEINVEDTNCSENEDERLLHDYLRLDVSLDEMYSQWSENDPKFKEIASKFQGVRMLKQDPKENIFSFICSSNNNITR